MASGQLCLLIVGGMVAASFAPLIRCCGVVMDETMMLLLTLVSVLGLAIMLVAVAVVLLTRVVVDETVMLLVDVVEDETVVMLRLVGGAVN